MQHQLRRLDRKIQILNFIISFQYVVAYLGDPAQNFADAGRIRPFP